MRLRSASQTNQSIPWNQDTWIIAFFFEIRFQYLRTFVSNRAPLILVFFVSKRAPLILDTAEHFVPMLVKTDLWILLGYTTQLGCPIALLVAVSQDSLNIKKKIVFVYLFRLSSF